MSRDYSHSFGYVESLPEDIREIFMWLCQDVAHIQYEWTFYLELFTSDEYKDVAELAKASFGVIEEAVRTNIIMSIGRISDPAQTSKKDNLSFKTLAQRCNDINDIDKLVDDFVNACEPIRKLRHKKIGHNDLNTRIDPLHNLLPGVGQKDYNHILFLAKQILNTVVQHYVSMEFMFDPVRRGGAKDLLFWLKSGKEYRKEKDKQFIYRPNN